ncbi:MAG: hypothetical protein IPN34_25900 [Planctomycetes bacterium]|nr:hypothetical protein [Planctomycetota bacterium]
MLEPSSSVRFRLELPEGLPADTLRVESERREDEAAVVLWKPQRKGRADREQLSFAFEDLVLGTYHFSIQQGRSVLHRFELEIASGAHDLGTIDLRELVQPLRFRFVPASGVREGWTLQLHSGAEAEAAFEVRPKPLGTLDLWIPKRCDRWVLLAEGQQHEGRCDQPMPIDLR